MEDPIKIEICDNDVDISEPNSSGNFLYEYVRKRVLISIYKQKVLARN